MRWLTRRPFLNHTRIRTAYAIAIVVDVLEWLLGPIGWAFTDEILDVAAMAALWPILGFHPALLPTFVVELFPVVDLFPTWTGCVAIVVALRKREQGQKTRAEPGDVIDV